MYSKYKISKSYQICKWAFGTGQTEPSNPDSFSAWNYKAQSCKT